LTLELFKGAVLTAEVIQHQMVWDYDQAS